MAKFLEYQGKEWLAKGGMPVPKGRVASSPEEAEEAARWIGRPRSRQGAGTGWRARQGRDRQAGRYARGSACPR